MNPVSNHHWKRLEAAKPVSKPFPSGFLHELEAVGVSLNTPPFPVPGRGTGGPSPLTPNGRVFMARRTLMLHDFSISSNLSGDGTMDHRVDPLLGDGHEGSIDDRLRDAGVSDEIMPEVIAITKAEAKREAWHLTTETLAWIGERLKAHSTHSASVAHALGLAEGLEGLAERFSVSKQSIGNSAAKLRRVFSSKMPAPPPPISRPPSDNGEIWLTMPEAKQLTGLGPSVIGNIGGSSRREYNNRRFYEKSRLVAACDAYFLSRSRDIKSASSELLSRPDIVAKTHA